MLRQVIKSQSKLKTSYNHANTVVAIITEIIVLHFIKHAANAIKNITLQKCVDPRNVYIKYKPHQKMTPMGNTL